MVVPFEFLQLLCSNCRDINFMSSESLFPREVLRCTDIRDKKVYKQSLLAKQHRFLQKG